MHPTHAMNELAKLTGVHWRCTILQAGGVARIVPHAVRRNYHATPFQLREEELRFSGGNLQVSLAANGEKSPKSSEELSFGQRMQSEVFYPGFQAVVKL